MTVQNRINLNHLNAIQLNLRNYKIITVITHPVHSWHLFSSAVRNFFRQFFINYYKLKQYYNKLDLALSILLALMITIVCYTHYCYSYVYVKL